MKTNKKYIKKNYLGFTLVELVVTISILAILGTISIISIQNFYGSARDSVRINDIKSIHQWLSIFQIKSGIYPLPEDSVEIINNSTVLFYQGYVWENISRIINTDKNPLDPKDTTRYIYAVDKNQKKAQLMGYLESGDTLKTTSYQDIFKNFVNQSYANANGIDYKNRFIYVEGDKIWVLTDENSAPIQESATGTGLNLSETNSGYVAYFWWDSYGEGKSTGTGDILITQILWAINNTIPCNPVTYSGYAISALSHNEMKTFTKPLSIANGSGTGSLQVQCQNGTIDTEHAIELTNVSCIANFVNTGDNTCVPDVCGGTIPTNSESTATSQTITQNWIHNTTPNICTFACKTNYTYNIWTNTCTANTQQVLACNGIIKPNSTDNSTTTAWTQTWNGTTWLPVYTYTHNTTPNICTYACNTGYTWDGTNEICTDQTPPTITSVTTSSPACNTVRFTINGASDIIWIHTTPYSFDGGTTWQAGNTKDYTSLNQTIAANQIQVRDAVGNIYTYASSVNGTSTACTCNLPWGGTVTNAGTTTAYLASNPTSPTMCTSETRTCTNGVLSGSYTNQTCTQQYRSCTGTPWGTVAHGYSNTAYSTTSLACGNSCSSYAQTRTCSDGTMNGSYGNTSCSVVACTSGPYSYGWWGSCNASCGWWTQYRTQYCNYDSCYSPQATSQSCNTQSCCAANYGQSCVKQVGNIYSGGLTTPSMCTTMGLWTICTTYICNTDGTWWHYIAGDYSYLNGTACPGTHGVTSTYNCSGVCQ